MGRLRNIIGALLHAPERFDELAERIAEMNRLQDRRAEELHGRIDESTRRVENLETRAGESDQRMDGAEKRIEAIDREADLIRQETEWIHRRIDSAEKRMDGMSAGKDSDTDGAAPEREREG